MRLLFVILTILLFTGCSLKKDLPIIGGELIESQGSYLYLPPNPQKAPSTLIFIIPAGKDYQMIKFWQSYANKHNFILFVSRDWDQEKLLTDLKQVQAEYQPKRTFVTGFSNGGYNSCYLGLKHPELVDGIIPLGAYCRTSDVDQAKLKQIKKIPILVVVGEKDVWARGEDYTYVDTAIADLKKMKIKQEQIIVPGVAHRYPVEALGEVVLWIEKQ